MPVYRGTQLITTGAQFKPDLRPNDRFGGRGGLVRARAVITGAGTVGDILETLFVGNELVENRSPIGTERAAGAGVDNFTPAIEEDGLPADVIDLAFINTNAASRSVMYVVEIRNN